MMNQLYHFGVLGMRWGVRRYQNKDGSLTPAGRKRLYDSGQDIYKGLSRSDAKNINQVWSSMDKQDKAFLVGNRSLSRHPERDLVSYKTDIDDVVYSHVSKYDKQPVSFLYMQGDRYSTSANIVIGTDSGHREKGLGSKEVEKGIEWFNKNPELSTLEWRAYADNIKSRKLAEKYGFKFNELYSTDEDYLFMLTKDKKAQKRAKKLTSKNYARHLKELEKAWKQKQKMARKK